jgi:hypothetical protein
MFRASPCPSSGEWYKTDNAYGVQHWLRCSRLVEKRWFGVHLLGLVSPIPTGANLFKSVLKDSNRSEVALLFYALPCYLHALCPVMHIDMHISI